MHQLNHNNITSTLLHINHNLEGDKWPRIFCCARTEDLLVFAKIIINCLLIEFKRLADE